ncbi:TetR family transcriptional regulator [Actinoplanes sp. SE50]|uniref:TetR/AcrR family transcriptional regulator n=1 Tax=unclassified Actinoplanes TaxID=2626549 RepID=UPI00023EC7FB|nr:MULTISPECIES: TetR family transcriptional regulator [unclassified Actinoplanes]AEV85343.1 putative HTH-type transcriptional regulator yttP [Actinoplanes sp. SE50/110]ATO83738.1 TetR family transcriptional regulator [Actinoplanes sp. SE50]SLM01146.1 TetR family transcriptional regulator [Actinoplanes sp. SE50/110]
MTSPRPRRSPPPQERRRDPERTRRKILEAAAVEFADHGYAGARTRAIAARAGVNQQLVSYYFGGKEGLYRAMSDQWRQRRDDLAPDGTPMPEQLRRYAMEIVHNPDGVRMFAWSGLQYTGPDDDPDRDSRTQMLGGSVTHLRRLQEAGRLPAEIDPVCLQIMLMAASMATTTLPHVIEGLCGADPRSPEFVEHYADQVALVARLLGLDED